MHGVLVVNLEEHLRAFVLNLQYFLSRFLAQTGCHVMIRVVARSSFPNAKTMLIE